jgi:hypothetical protein
MKTSKNLHRLRKHGLVFLMVMLLTIVACKTVNINGKNIKAKRSLEQNGPTKPKPFTTEIFKNTFINFMNSTNGYTPVNILIDGAIFSHQNYSLRSNWSLSSPVSAEIYFLDLQPYFNEVHYRLMFSRFTQKTSSRM